MSNYDPNDEDYSDSLEEDESFMDCPKCGRSYSKIDHEYQLCSKCGWDAEKGKWEKPQKPTRADYEMGEADLMTGQWI